MVAPGSRGPPAGKKVCQGEGGGQKRSLSHRKGGHVGQPDEGDRGKKEVPKKGGYGKSSETKMIKKNGKKTRRGVGTRWKGRNAQGKSVV